jgi:membrane protein implicated in regulation of membrane protease activity
MDAQGLVWLGLALLAGVVEIFTLSLVFAMVGGGALVAALVGGLTGSAPAAVIAFAVSTSLLLAVVRPPLLRYSERIGPGSGTGVAALVGRKAEVVGEVSDVGGLVKLAGETWTARPEHPGDVLEIGSSVYVIRIAGATAVVSPLPPDSSAQRDPHDPAALPGGDPPKDRPES